MQECGTMSYPIHMQYVIENPSHLYTILVFLEFIDYSKTLVGAVGVVVNMLAFCAGDPGSSTSQSQDEVKIVMTGVPEVV